MNESKNLLVELFVEELPPKALKTLGAAFGDGITVGLRRRGLATDASQAAWFASPRRLALHLTEVAAVAADRETVTKLMPAPVAFDADGKPTGALRKRLAREGHEALADRWPHSDAAAPDRLFVQRDGNADAVFLGGLAQGMSLQAGLQASLDDALAKLPIPKVMQYQLDDGWTSVKFVRPAHGLVALHGAEVVPVGVLGLRAGRTTHGHRFEAATPAIELRDADSYVAQLRDVGAVIAGFDERRAEIVRQIGAAAAREGLQAIDDDALLDEVTALVERPNVLLCRFEREFLDVPPECLILTMKANQKYFPLLDAAGRLTERFLVVANVRPADPRRVIEGNERVVRPRLADAKFFYDQDRKKTLASRVPALDQVIYHGKLGTQGARVVRIRAIARWVAERIGANAEQAERAAGLAKADLLTDMVGEFPELQGVMGGYYAAHDGEPAEVAAAIAAQYQNRRSRDATAATNLVGEALLIADRAETLVGIWGIGGKPTGEKDPYALRRHALTLIRSFESVVAAQGSAASRLALRELLQFASTTFDAAVLQPGTVEQVEDFIYERYANQLAAGIDARTVDAVIGQRPPLQQVVRRLEAVRAFQCLDAAAALAAANKRVGNILRKSEAAPPAAVDSALLREPGEIALHGALAAVAPVAQAHFESGDYAASLQALAALRAPVDSFFDSVMVNAEDPALRANRLALLATLHAAMNRVADLSKLAT
ncbi:MAG: glycine--tRNA ligase subunit beta [Caldimonas sp.]